MARNNKITPTPYIYIYNEYDEPTTATSTVRSDYGTACNAPVTAKERQAAAANTAEIRATTDAKLKISQYSRFTRDLHQYTG